MSSTSTECDKDSPCKNPDDAIDDDDETPPSQDDCCNSGCTPCVFDIYRERLERKKKKKMTGEEKCRYDLLSETKFKPFILLEKRDFGECYSRLTFQPMVSTNKITTEQKVYDNMVGGEKKDCNNMVAGEKDCNNKDAEEKKECNSMVAEGKNCINMVAQEKNCNNTIAEEMDCDNMIAEEEDNIIKEQHIGGFLPYKPGQHLAMKSWVITNLKDHQKLGRCETLDNLGACSSNIASTSANVDRGDENRKDYQRMSHLEDGNRNDNQGISNLLDQRERKEIFNHLQVSGPNQGTTSANNKDRFREQIYENFMVSPEEVFDTVGGSSKNTKFETNSSPSIHQPTSQKANVPESIFDQTLNITQVPEFGEIEQDERSIFPVDQGYITYSKEAIMGTTKPNFITRDYTPITLPQNSLNCCFQIIIKYYQASEMSKYLKSLKNGDKVYFRGPYGDFRYLKNHNHLLAVCMGTGIAPIYAIFRSILDDENDETFMKIIYGCKNVANILLRDELREMAKFWNFGLEFYLTSDNDLEFAKFGENFRAGRIQKSCVYENLKQNQLVLICGSETFNSEIVGYLSEFPSWKVEYFVF